MRTPYEQRIAEATAIERQICQGTDKIVVRKFGTVARALWPEKTNAHVAAICGCGTRQADRYISGECSIPYVMCRAVCDLMLGVG